MVYGFTWQKEEEALLDSTSEQNTFRFPKRMCCPVANGSPASHKQFRIFLQDNHRNMHLLISFDRLSQSYRNKGPTFSAQVGEKTDERYFPTRWGYLVRRPYPSLIAFKNNSDEILVVFKLIEYGRQNGLSQVFKTGCRPFLRVFGPLS
jgi:hypothetical protein